MGGAEEGEGAGPWKDLDAKVFEERASEEARRLASKYGYRPYVVERYLELLGSEAEELLEANEEPMPQTFRCNDFRVSCSELVARLGEMGFEVEKLPYLPHGYASLSSPVSLGATHEYLKGFYYLQGPGSMIVAYLLDPRPGELIVDMAAAPGGKTSQILQLTRDSATVVAVEPKRSRIRALRSNLQRLGFSNYVIVRGDARYADFGGVPDRVLLDAPSSGEGIIRKDPSRKTKTSIDDLRQLHYLQLSLLRRALSAVRPGGTVVYSACSTAVEEGEYVVHKALSERDDVDAVPIDAYPVRGAFEEYRGVAFDDRVRRCGRIFPHVHGTEGFFLCVLRRQG